METLDRALFASMAVDHPGPLLLASLMALAQWPLYGVPLLLAGLWVRGGLGDRAAAVGAALSAVLALLLAFGASRFVDHPRPFMLGLAQNSLDHAPDSSFPSDHATLFFALAIGFRVHPARSVPWLWLPLALTGLVLGWARVALGVHFPLDIVGAVLIAALAVALMSMTPLRRARATVTGFAEAIRRRVRVFGFDEPEGSDARPAG